MKNALFWGLVAVVFVILALLAYGIYLSVTKASSGFDVATTVCTGFILVGSLVAWEVLMKPGYYRRRIARPPPEEPEQEPAEAPSRPPSR